MVRNPTPWVGGYVLPNAASASAYQVLAPIAYPRVKYLIEQACASGLVSFSPHASDFTSKAVRPYLDRYLSGSNGYSAVERAKIMKLLWDSIGSEFGARHELYEINYSGSTEEIRRHCLFTAMATGETEKMTGFAEQCMAEYDLDGWLATVLFDAGEQRRT
jgi:4-hydroxyphenylacetate 3-monooxygenase